MQREDYEKERAKDLQRLKMLRPIDDDFMRCLFKDNIPLVQYVLRVFTRIEDLNIISVETQVDMKRLAGARSLCLDAYGTDSDGKRYDLEIQREDRGAGTHRARYHSSVMDVENLNAGQDFEELPDTYVIFVTENDIFGAGCPVYPIERKNLATDELFQDGEHILYVNGAYRGENEIGKLLHDFSCSNPNDMYNKDLADVARYYKETEKGADTMCKLIEEMRMEWEEKVAKEVSVKTYLDTCREFGMDDQKELVEKLLAKFDFLSKEQAVAYVQES